MRTGMDFSVVLISRLNPRSGAHHVKSAMPWKGCLQPQSKSLLHKIRSKPRPTASARARAADLRHGPEPEIVDQLGSVS